MFGAIPGSVYGWPKSVLHWKGIDRSILDINSTMAAHFVIVDGIVAMEGNGPLHGTARDLGRIVMSDDQLAADFTCARLTGFDPSRISHLAQAAQFLGNGMRSACDSGVSPAWAETGGCYAARRETVSDRDTGSSAECTTFTARPTPSQGPPSLQTGRSIRDQMIAAVFGKCDFDAEMCADGIQALWHCRHEVDEKLGSPRKEFLHDWASHGDRDDPRGGAQEGGRRCAGRHPGYRHGPLMTSTNAEMPMAARRGFARMWAFRSGQK